MHAWWSSLFSTCSELLSSKPSLTPTSFNMAKHIERSLLDPLGLFSILYQAVQLLISFVFSPPVPANTAARKPLGQVAVIGSGWTGISSAAHLVGHGFEVTIFESSDKLGGIWSKTNETSGLQISSLMYRPHPAVVWSLFFPKTPEILEQIEKVAHRYELMDKIRFNTPVTLVERHSSSTDPKEGGHGRWIINGDSNRVYDGIVVAVGTCGKPKMFKLPGQEKFKGKIVHSSQLDGVELKGKKVSRRCRSAQVEVRGLTCLYRCITGLVRRCRRIGSRGS